MFNKKRNILYVVVLFLTMFIASCSSNAPPAGGASESGNRAETTAAAAGNTSDLEKVTITYSFYGGQESIDNEESFMQSYMDANPNVTIEGTYTDGGEYPTKLQTYFASGTAPDVMRLAADMYGDFAEKGLFLDITDQANDILEEMIPFAVDSFTMDGKVYAIPFCTKPYMIIYNKQIFDAAGVSYPESGWTEDDFIETAIKLTEGEGVEKIWGANFGWITSEMIKNWYGVGSGPINNESYEVNIKGNEKFKHLLSLLHKLYIELQVVPDSVAAESVGGGFETGKFAMAIGGYWDVAGLQKVVADSWEWDFAPFPTHPEYGRWHCGLRVDGIGLSPSGKYVDTALDFASFYVTSGDVMLKCYDSIPTLMSYVYSDDYINTFLPEWPNKFNKEVLIEGNEFGFPIYWTGVWGKLYDEIWKQYSEFILGNISLDEAIDLMQTNCEVIMADR